MPDYCTNTLLISAETEDGKKQLEELKQKCTSVPEELLGEEPFVFGPAFPIPQDLIDDSNCDTEDWCYRNWSTLEPLKGRIFFWSDTGCNIEFETPYEPPLNWLKKVSKDYPDLSFTDYYDDIDKKSVIYGRNGLFYDGAKYIKDVVEVTSNNLKDYPIGIMLQPNNKKGNPYRFTMEVTGPNSVIVEFELIENGKYWEKNINYSLYHKLFIELIEKRAKEKGDVKLTFESTGSGGYYYNLCYASEFHGLTIDEIVEQSLSFMEEIEGPLYKAIKKHEVLLEEDLKEELNLLNTAADDDSSTGDNAAAESLETKNSKQSKATGTREWADTTLNCITGCKHDCLYCFAKASSIRYGMKTPESWKDEIVRQKDLEKHIKKYEGLVMFPSSHDIYPDHLQENMEFLQHILEAGNEVLIVTKPHFECIKEICHRFKDYKDKILFRFTIGSADDSVLKFWEPYAPDFSERLESIKWAYKEGFKTSVSCEPMLDNNIDKVIDAVSPYVTETIWLGKINGLIGVTGRGRLDFNGCNDPATLARAHELIAWQSDANIIVIYNKYKNNQLIQWKDSIQKVIDKQSGIKQTIERKEVV